MIKRFFKSGSLAQSFVVYTITDLLSKALPFLVFPLVITYLNPEDFGFVTNFNVLTQIIGAIMGLHLGTYITAVYYKSSSSALKKIFSTTMLLYLLIALVIFIIILFFNEKIGQLSAIPLKYQLYAVVTVIGTSLASLTTTLLRLQEKPRIFAVFVLSNVFLGSFLTFLFLYYFKKGVEGRIFSIVIPAAVFGIVSFYLLLKNKKLKLNIYKDEILNQLQFGIPMLPHTLSFWLKSGLDRIIITSYIGLAANGLFSIGATFSSIFFILNSAFNNAYIPHLYKKLSKEDIIAADKIKIVKELYFYITIYTAVIIIGYFIINILVSKYFKNYIDSLVYLPYFLVFNIFNVLYQIAVNFIFFKKKTKYLGLITFSTTLLQALLSFLLIEKYQLHGIGFAMVISSIILFAVIFYFSNKSYKMPWLLR